MTSSKAREPQPSPESFFESRGPARQQFLKEWGWGGADLAPLNEDWASRRYFRAALGGRKAVLMDGIPDHLGGAAPGHKMADFIRIAPALRQAGIRVPEIFASDLEQGFVLMEDLGDISLAKALDRKGPAQELYSAAADVLVRMRKSIAAGSFELPHYRDTHIHARHRFVIDWYARSIGVAGDLEKMAADYLGVWEAIESGLPPCPEGFVHGDYHAGNLMWLADGAGSARCGVLDFQGAMWGPLPYDLVNLLEDARRDVSSDIQRDVIRQYVGGLNKAEADSFAAWYRVLGTQFHCRVIGQLLRLAVNGKPQHMEHIPRLQAYLKKELEDPVLAPLKKWFEGNSISFDETPDLRRLA